MQILIIIPIIITILVLSVFIYVFGMLFSSKFRNKFMERQLKAEKSMLDRNEGLIKELEKRNAEIEKIGIETKARALRKGFGKETIYCKHCGSTIDIDSRFCKNCGQKQ